MIILLCEIINNNNKSEIFWIFNIKEIEIIELEENSIFDEYYDEFANIYDITCLNKSLSTIIPNPPLLDGKSLFKVTAYDALQKLQSLLERFLRECCVRKDVFSNKYFKEFLNLEKETP